jgi:hypothetical protein
MKIQLDTTNKSIKVESDVKFSELIKALEKILPKGEWKEFTLETNAVISHWHEPIIIKKYLPYEPFPQPWITWSTSGDTRPTADYSLKSGIFNIEF